jgi:hypothetical protein
MSRTPEKGTHSPSWPNGLIIISIIIIHFLLFLDKQRHPFPLSYYISFIIQGQ